MIATTTEERTSRTTPPLEAARRLREEAWRDLQALRQVIPAGPGWTQAIARATETYLTADNLVKWMERRG